MVYPYVCNLCEYEFDVIKKLADFERPENCPQCRGIARRGVCAPAINKTAAGSWNQVEFNPGLGCWTKSHKHAEQIAKSRGMEPVGNEDPEKIHKHYEKQREETRRQRYEDAERVKVFE